MPGLFDKLAMGPLELKNRFVMAPLTRCRAGEERIPNDLMAEYYGQRSGAGLIISEGTQVNENGIGYPDTPGIHLKEQIEGWKTVTGRVHREGGHIFAQLWHVGRISHPDLIPGGNKPLAPSAVAAEGHARTKQGKKPFPVPRHLDPEEVKSTIKDFIRAGKNAMEAGFDGVELHGANGYLPEQFLNDHTNLRTDEYGGSREKRYRFILEILQGLVETCGADRVGIRLSPSGVRFGTLDSDPVNTYSGLVKKLNEFPLAYIHIVEPLTEIPKGYLGHVLPHFRRIYDGRVITAGGYDPEKAREVVEGGMADMVAFGRAFIANPDLPRRVELDAPLNEAAQKTFYMGGYHGYTDYPFLKENGKQWK